MKTLILITAFFISIQGFAQLNRSYDGTNNNLNNPEWGAADAHFRNFATNAFGDLISEPGGQDRPNPREISNAIGSQTEFIANELELSDFIWGWGQFIDHDVNLNDDNFDEPNDIPVPMCEPLFDPNCTGNETLRMFRSKSDPATGTSINNPRKHINDITSYIDGSAVYGSDINRANWLRTFVDGKLKTSSGDLLPWNTVDGEFDSAIDPAAPFMVLDGFPLPEKFFVGGDIRVNEQPGLSCFHTLWVREHNRLCDEIKDQNPSWNDEEIFQRARKIVGALIQVVTYEEFLPHIGIQIDPYAGYDDTVEPNILNTFSAAGYRFGHTMVNGRLVRYEENGDDWVFGAVDLRDGFFNPAILKDEGGIEPFFRGLAAQEHQLVDPLIMDDIRNFLFGQPGSGGIDLLSINLARARERGIPDYNTFRTDLSLTPHADFNSLTSDPVLSGNLATVYEGDIGKLDPWIGFMSEDHLPNALVGEGLHEILKLQFQALRDGDRYYYENDPAFTTGEIDELKSTKLSEIILRNSSIETLQEDVFIAVPRDLLAVEFFPFPEVKSIELTAYPNPVQKYFNLVIESSRPSSATLSIYGVSGQIISQQAVQLNRGRNELNFELSDQLANGLYVVSLDSDNGAGQLKLIKRGR
ncbi:MAG: T9SS type A sorting domain-containing protein [Bacteroidia bacterium]|nr:T9SS type A sorting domain-containing protein [Bacteroidia bacterium]MBT8276043.1 T9SS type A sorting domain-containing protein [Bacteroidia bacterium]NNJ80874.1 T9SS type A sorting domain-containing protein [Flavobacteriaceae bacterium]NNK53682.1 T9SS type A sorting domain-containing protein [Flavobacteriaceae bacterium]